MANKLRLVSWNVAKRIKRLDDQVAAIQSLETDVVALQEILLSSHTLFKEKLAESFPWSFSSFDLAEDQSVFRGKRMFGQLLLSRLPMNTIDPGCFKVPWPERVLSGEILIAGKNLEIHTTHIPPGSSNGWIKIEMIDGIVEYLCQHDQRTHILCGDFNTPKFESLETGLVTFAQELSADGKIKTKKKFRIGEGSAWDKGERSLFTTLPEYGLKESFRSANPYDFDAYSWTHSRQGRVFRNRFDHFFASSEMEVRQCKYIHEFSELSDHSPLLVEYEF